MQATNGDILLAGTAGTIWLVYLTSYMYYEYEKEQEIKMAEAKRQKTPVKPKKIISKPEKTAHVEPTKEAGKNSVAQTTLKSNIVTYLDATDGTIKTETSMPFTESRESDRSMTEKESVSSD